ncbi:DUF4468 domain-containing protein [Spirosoma endbachense]|uniref:DUF4468 domain-containing protein n=1 Tax=Spirosoma endbachense TaxID=2666025 RepID=A0A6P1VYG7_9BACT|nr:DUF4468 domain-containing protein [Spirosoma endbachense]QHV97132.1 DUF4468 domain-containing protein [Spirosoma endbachense]
MKILIPLLVLLSINVLAQVKLPTNDLGQVQYQELVRLPDATRPTKQIITQARSWLAQQFPNESDAEQQFDQEHNILFVKSAYRIDDQLIRYTLTIESKFGRYRATITDLIAEGNGLSLPVRPDSPTAEEMSRSSDNKPKSTAVINQAVRQQADLYRQIDKECHDTLASLKEYMVSLAAKKTE